MLKVDLRQLARKRRLVIDYEVRPDDPLWQRTGTTLVDPLAVRLDVQLAGQDVIVRGELQTRVGLACRRCLVPVTAEVDEEVAWVFRPGLTRAEAEEAEVFPLPERGDELDLVDAIREQVVLSVPQYAMCSETCRGLCGRCGANLNQAQCNCEVAEPDPRWSALRKLRTE
ncbi:MAG: YceD family protein [Longimicrobiales bacterium]